MSVAPETITVRFLGTTGATVGAGWLVSETQVITCAHVVNSALGRDRFCTACPVDPIRIMPPAALNRDTSDDLTPRWTVQKWSPVSKASGGGFEGDVALLTSDSGKVLAPRKFAALRSSDLTGASFLAFGYPQSVPQGRSARGEFGSRANRRIELIPSVNSKELPTQGFSGAPVIAGGFVAGIVASDLAEESRAYMIPVDDIVELLPDLLEPAPDRSIKFPHLKHLASRLKPDNRGRLKGTVFDLRAVAVENFERIVALTREPSPETYSDGEMDASRFLEELLKDDRRVVLSAPGGSGKTHFLIDVARYALFAGLLPFWLNLKELNGVLEKEDKLALAQRIFNNCSIVGDYKKFEEVAAADADNVVIFADGLNERGDASFDRIAEALFQLTNAKPGVALVIGVRMSYRAILTNFRWTSLSPLSGEEIHQHLQSPPAGEHWKRLLSSPFFLALFLQLGSTRTLPGNVTRNVIFRRYFAEHVFQDDPDKWDASKLARAAFSVYETASAPWAPQTVWEQSGFDNQMLTALESAGALIHAEGEPTTSIGFRHQLLHDWCAACHVARLDESDWNNKVFDSLTLHGASSDAIDMVAEQLVTNQTSRFLIRTYDWSWSAVLEAILNLELGRHGGKSEISTDFRDAMFALNALRRFDVFEHTQGAIRELLQGYSKLEGALALMECKKPSDVISLVSKRFPEPPSDPLLTRWRDRFLRASDGDCRELDDLGEDPFLSWTATNLMRMRIGGVSSACAGAAARVYQALRKEAVEPQSAIGWRWRIVHLLGAANEEWIPKFLEGVLFDDKEHDWVRYGAARSLLEQAARSAERERRTGILDMLTRRLGEIASPKIRGELRRATIIGEGHDAPEGWYEGVGNILREGMRIAQQELSSDVVNWERRLSQVAKRKGSLV